MLHFSTILKKFKQHGEKTGWTYIEISQEQANLLKPNTRKSFRIKGKIDKYPVSNRALLPMGDGAFIMAIDKTIQKALWKEAGEMVDVFLELDADAFRVNADFLDCLNDEPAAKTFFSTLPLSHQKYFSNWIDTAKTDATKIRRIVMAIGALSRETGFGEMLREQKADKNQLNS